MLGYLAFFHWLTTGMLGTQLVCYWSSQEQVVGMSGGFSPPYELKKHLHSYWRPTFAPFRAYGKFRYLCGKLTYGFVAKV